MTTHSFIIPTERLPPGFAENVDTPSASAAEALPAATAVLMRDADDGLEVLLLRRTRSSGFVPGAYVFAGGRVDEADSDAALRDVVHGAGATPPLEYWVAAARELFEETGVLLAADAARRTSVDDRLAWRNALLDDEYDMRALLQRESLTLDLSNMAYAAHWITPLAEPRRYDTHFFYAALPAGMAANADAREMTDARWITPQHALDEFANGELPMVFPTVKTLESLVAHARVADALAEARRSHVEPILPRLVRADHGVAIVLDEEREAGGA
jgi:8-oxo-dGTP pyrophosphatase MutT (NUDIX family)